MPRNLRERWHDKSIAALTTRFCTDTQQGLTPHEAAQRLQRRHFVQRVHTVSWIALVCGVGRP